MIKLMKKIAIVVATGLFLSGFASAAPKKIAVVNFQEVMGKIPQSAVVMKSLEEEFKDKKAELTQLEADIKYNQEKKKRDGALMSKKDIAALDKKITTLYQSYQTKGQAFQKETTARKNQETNKIIALVRQAIDNIAAKGKYDLILEQSAVVFVQPDLNITAEVISQVSKLK